MAETLTLKWGTLKGWDDITSERSKGLLQQYLDLGVSYSVMAQHDTPEQKQIICESGFISEPDDTGARTLAK